MLPVGILAAPEFPEVALMYGRTPSSLAAGSADRVSRSTRPFTPL